MEWRATYTTAQNTPITASVHFDFPACPFPAAQALCLGYGGTFGHDDQLAGGTRSYLWTCNNLPADFPFPSGNDALAQRCFADGGTLFVYNPAPGASTCFND